jgi:uncharacterized protein (DUF697 family)
MTDHLKGNRTLILSRALLAGAAGMLPVPYLDDLLAGAVRSAMIRRIAELRGVDVDANAVDELAHPSGSRVLNAASIGAIALGGTKRAFRKLAASILIVRRSDEAVQTFYLGTLFDHYCAKHHVGVGVDGKKAAVLRASIDLAAKQARSEALSRAFKKSLKLMSAAAMKMPKGAFSMWSRRRGGPVQAERVPSVNDRLDAAASESYVKDAVKDVESEVAGRGYVRALAESFDLAWAAAMAQRPPT